MKPFKSPSQVFASISRNLISHRAWFAKLSFHDHPPSRFADFLLISLEYIQLMVQLLIVNQVLYTGSSGTAARLFDTIIAIYTTISPGYLLATRHVDPVFALNLFIGLFSCTVLKYALFIYICVLTVKKKSGSPTILVIWRWTFHLQCKFVYHFISAFWFGFIRNALSDRLGLPPTLKYLTIVFFSSLIGLEFILSFGLVTQISYSIPNKRLIASKNYHIEVITLIQKFVAQIVRISLISNSHAAAWITSSVHLGFCTIRNLYYFKTFPHYHLEAVLYQVNLLMAVTSLAIAFLAQSILVHIYDDQLNKGFWIVIWIILTILSTTFFRGYVKRVWLQLVTQTKNIKRQLLIHRLIAIKQLLSATRTPDQPNGKYLYPHVVKMTIVTRFQSPISPIQESQEDIQNPRTASSKKEFIQKFIMEYLEDLLVQFPSDDLIRLYIANYYVKKLKKYGRAMKILRELQHSSSSSTALNASLIIYSLQHTIKLEYKNHQNRLNIYSYIKNINFVSQLKEDMFKQAELQVAFYNNFTQKGSPDLNEVFHLGQKVNQQRCVVERKIQNLTGSIPEYYIEPLMLCAHYSLVLNHAPHKYLHHTRTYAQRYRKYEKAFLVNDICPENLYQKENRVMIISGNKKDLGIVHYMSNNFLQTIGKDIIGHHVCSTMPERFRSASYQITNGVLEQGDKQSFLDSLVSTFEYNFQEGNFLPCLNYFNISPFLSGGLFYLLLIRIHPQIEECVFANENSEIIGFTPGIGKKLGLSLFRNKDPNQTLHLNLISKKLAHVNQVFNMIFPLNNSSENDKTSYEDIKTLTYEEAQNICSIFSTKGDIIQLSPLQKIKFGSIEMGSRLTYHCKVETKFYAYNSVRVFGLKKVLDSSALKRNTTDKIKLDQLFQQIKEEEEKEKDKEEEEEESEIDIESEHLAEIPIEPENPSIYTQQYQRTNEPLLTNLDSQATSRMLLLPGGFGGRIGIPERLSSEMIHSNIEDVATPKSRQRDRIQGQNIRIPDVDVDEGSLCQSSQAEKRSQIAHIKLSRAFERAVFATYIPKFFSFLILVLYLAFVSILTLQITLHLSINTDIGTLDARKSLMKLSATRTDMLSSVYGVTRDIWMFAMDLRNASDYSVNFQPSYYMTRLNSYLQNLIQVNMDMMMAMDSIDPDSRAQLMQSDIRVFYANLDAPNQHFINMTSFQATDKIIEASLRALTVGNISLSAALPEFNFTLRNTMSDPLVISEDFDRFLRESIDQQADLIINRNTLNLVINCGLLGLTFMIFCFNVVKQYQSEKRNMTALGKLEQKEIIKIMDRVITFQTMLQKEEEFKLIQSLENYGSSTKPTKEHYGLPKRQANNKDFRKYHLEGTTRKYQLYPIKFMAYVTVIIGLILANFFVINNFITNINYIVNQLFFSAISGPRLKLALVITLDMTSGSSTEIRNQSMLEQFDVEINTLQNAIHIISDILKKRDKNYDPIIQGILFGNACDYTTPHKVVDAYCKQLEQIKDTSGLITHMTDYQNILLNFKEAYNQCNKSIQALNDLDTQSLPSRTQIMLLVTNLMTVISNRLDSSFKDVLTQGKTSINVTRQLIVALLIITPLLLHKRLINELKCSDSGFRNLLKMFPARVVLSNFMLTTFLTKTGKGSLKSTKLLQRD